MVVELGPLEASRAMADIEPAASTRSVPRAVSSLEDSLASVRGAAAALMSAIEGMPKASHGLALDEVSLELGVRLGVEGGVIVARGSMEADTSVILTWRARATGD
jgi:hypothetical protein